MMRRLLLLAAVLASVAVSAAVPNEDAVPAYAEEQTILQAEKDTPEPGWTSLASGRTHGDRHWIVPIGRESESDLILQRGGNTWRTIRNGPLSLAAGVVLLLAAAAILGVWRFSRPGEQPEPSGKTIVRFTLAQRVAHWTTAICFLLLAFSGLVVLFGKKLLLPLIGHQAFSMLAISSKYVHNVVGPVFVLCSLLMFFMYLRHNHFNRSDVQWLRRAGGLLSREPPPAGYFNAGEKAWFWFGVVLLGLLMSITGLVLDFVVFGQTRYLLQWADYLHIGGAMIYIAAAMGHIYLGTVGTPGAYQAMRRGSVDENWARVHHRLWYEKLRG